VSVRRTVHNLAYEIRGLLGSNTIVVGGGIGNVCPGSIATMTQSGVKMLNFVENFDERVIFCPTVLCLLNNHVPQVTEVMLKFRKGVKDIEMGYRWKNEQ
jgi:hypothetical protein